MIRDIVDGDKEQILRLVEMFFKECMEPAGLCYSPETAGHHFDVFIEAPGLLALCAEEEGQIVGLIAGTASAILFAKELAMQEMIWYVEPSKRKCGMQLLQEFEKRSTDLGLHCILMTGFTNSPVPDLYLRLGYKETQKIFLKLLR